MKLYGSLTSPFVRHCRIALMEEGLEAEFCKADNLISATMSPMQKVPFMECEIDGKAVVLSDSLAILKLIREKNGSQFIPDVKQLNDFCAATTIMDASINIFYLEKDGIAPSQSAYLKRQAQRVQTGLQYFENTALSEEIAFNDTALRLVCFLDWAIFRNRISLENFPSLRSFLRKANQYSLFTQTKPQE